MNRGLIIIILLFIVMPFVGRSSVEKDDKAPKVSATISPSTIMIGDQPIITVTVTKDVTHKIGFPDFPQEMSEHLEMLFHGAIDTLRDENSREMTLIRKYVITTFQAGEHTIDGIPIFYVNGDKIDTLYSQPLKMQVNTYQIDTTKQTIYDIKQPIHTPLLLVEIEKYIYWGLFGLIVAVILIYIIIKLRRKEAIFTRAKVPPHIRAASELNKIKDMKLWQQGKHKEYYTMITDIIRNYLDERFHKNAMEMTTEEIMESIKDDTISQVDKDMLQELLMLADLVKFAKLTPQIDDNENSFIWAYNFVEHTKSAEEISEEVISEEEVVIEKNDEPKEEDIRKEGE